MTEGVDVMLRGEVVGFYANPIAISVECSQAVVTGKQPGEYAQPVYIYTSSYNSWHCKMLEMQL